MLSIYLSIYYSGELQRRHVPLLPTQVAAHDLDTRPPPGRLRAAGRPRVLHRRSRPPPQTPHTQGRHQTKQETFMGLMKKLYL